MILAGMIAADEDALICDLAETYSVLNYRALPVPLLATLAAGLRGSSRIKTKMLNRKIQPDTMLLAAMVDRLSFLAWAQTEDARNGSNRPRSVLEALIGDGQASGDFVVYDSIEEYESARAAALGGDDYGQ
jgi:hypothetical protein